MISFNSRILSFAVFVAVGAAGTSAQAQSRLILRLQPGVSPASIATKYRIVLTDVTANAPFALYTVRTAAEGDRIQLAMATDQTIVWAEDDANVVAPEGVRLTATRPSKGSTLPAVGDRLALHAYNANALKQISWNPDLAKAAGRAVRVAILDTGLGLAQKGLWAKVDASANFVEAGTVADDKPRLTDSNRNGALDEATGHGTMVAGIIDQVSPQSRFVIARVADSDGNATAWTIVKGLAFAVTSGAEVANVSLGTLERVPSLTDVMDWCEAQRLLVVAAMGNDRLRRSCFPARISKVVSVAGLLPDNTAAPFTNWESGCDVSAPATGIGSQFWDGTTAIWSGTSFATPFVTGTIADALRRTTRQTPDRLRDAVRYSVTDLDRINPDKDGELGGLLNFVRFHQRFRQTP
jgi:subtilisin family serine protease